MGPSLVGKTVFVAEQTDWVQFNNELKPVDCVFMYIYSFYEGVLGLGKKHIGYGCILCGMFGMVHELQRVQ